MELERQPLPDKKNILTFIEYLKAFVLTDFEEINLKAYGNTTMTEKFLNFIDKNQDKCVAFFKELDNLKKMLEMDLKFFFESDPACNSYEEIISCYPGYHAIFYYRVAHILYNLDLKIIARIITEEAHKNTGIDIHPGAQIGEHFFIDHGTGIVIGETAIIGNYVKIYQGVTLGGLSLSLGQKLKNTKRHPTVGDNVTIYAGASILGGDVVIGNNVTIGSNVFLTKSVPDNTKVIISEPELIMKAKKN